MARRLLIAFVLALLPLVAVVGHPELRRVIGQDIRLILVGEIEILSPHAGTEERRAILELETRQPPPDYVTKAREYVSLYEQFRQPYLLAAAIRQITLQSLFPTVTPLSPQFVQKLQQRARELLSVSERLAAVDRQNAFPHLMRCVAYTSLGQRQEALDALRVAASCSVYNGYEHEWLRAVSSPSLSAEERFIAASRGLLFPHLSQLRHTFKRIREWANQMERRGQHREALQVAGWMMRCGAVMRDSGDTYIQMLVGTALHHTAWQRQPMPSKSTEPPDERYRLLAQQFGRYARQHGRHDLAEQALVNVDAFTRIREALERATDSRGRMLRRLFALRAGGFLLQLWAWAWLLPAVCALAMAPLWYSAQSVRDGVLPWTAALPFAGVLIALSVAAALPLYPFAGVFQQLADPISNTPPAQFATFSLLEWSPRLYQLAVLAPTALALVCFTVPLWQIARRARQGWTAGSAVLGLLLAFSIASSGEALGLPLPYQNVFQAVLTFAVMLLGLGGLLFTPLYAFLFHRPLPLPFRWGIAALWGLMSLTAWAGAPFWTALWLAGGLVLWLLWGRSLSEEAHLETQRAAYRFGMSALILAILGLWLYAALGYLSLPVRAQQHAYMNQLIEHGEGVLLQRTR